MKRKYPDKEYLRIQLCQMYWKNPKRRFEMPVFILALSKFLVLYFNNLSVVLKQSALCL